MSMNKQELEAMLKEILDAEKLKVKEEALALEKEKEKKERVESYWNGIKSIRFFKKSDFNTSSDKENIDFLIKAGKLVDFNDLTFNPTDERVVKGYILKDFDFKKEKDFIFNGAAIIKELKSIKRKTKNYFIKVNDDFLDNIVEENKSNFRKEVNERFDKEKDFIKDMLEVIEKWEKEKNFLMPKAWTISTIISRGKSK